MNWSDIKDTLAKVAPTLGGLIGGPAGAGIGSMLSAALGCANTPDAVQQALAVDPQAAVKLAQIEASVQIAQINAASQQVQSVNATLQADARGDSWWQKNHHAFESSFALLMVAAIYIILPILKIAVPVIDPTVWLMIGGILGVTAWQHGEVNKRIANQIE